MNLRLTGPFFAPLLITFAGALVVACSGGNDRSTSSTSGDDSSDTSTTTTTTTSSGAGGAGSSSSSTTGAGGAGGTPVSAMIKSISGDVSWNVTFDDAAKAAGATDCVYTRHYEGVEDRSAPWLCPTCEIMFRADVMMTTGKADCFPQVSTSQPAASEWIGYDNAGNWWRSSEGPTTMQGTATVKDPDITTMNSVTDLDYTANGMNVGKYSFAITGSLKLGDTEGDPLHGWVPPSTYACGWPKANPPAYTGNYTIVKGNDVPDGLFRDKCDEVVRLHDLKGTYLVVDMSAMDCPPCQSLATDEETLVADMKAQNIDVKVVTLLAPSLANPVGMTTKANLNTWITKFKLESPVLADRGWGLAMFEPIYMDQTGYPSLVIVDPNLKVVDTMVGFGTIDDIEQIIKADATP